MQFNLPKTFMQKNNKKQKNFHVIYGRHAVKAVLDNQRRLIYKLFIDENIDNAIEFDKNIDVEYISKDRLFRMCKDGDKHQGYIAHVSDLIEDLKLNDYIDIFKKEEKASIVILDQINDPHNLGAILRSARCFDIDLVIITAYNMPQINSSVIRSSAGMSEYVNILTVTNINQTIAQLKDSGFYTIGMECNTKSRNISDIVKENQKLAFVMGSEGSGMRPSIKESCNELVQIKIHKDADSLNVSNAAAIMMYELFKK